MLSVERQAGKSDHFVHVSHFFRFNSYDRACSGSLTGQIVLFCLLFSRGITETKFEYSRKDYNG